MLALHGTGVSEGISLGKAHVLRRKRLDTREYVIPESLLEEEVTRFNQAHRRIAFPQSGNYL